MLPTKDSSSLVEQAREIEQLKRDIVLIKEELERLKSIVGEPLEEDEKWKQIKDLLEADIRK